jgi:hypothetical protein
VYLGLCRVPWTLGKAVDSGSVGGIAQIILAKKAQISLSH